MHRAARGTNRSGRLGWRMLFGGFAVLLVSVALERFGCLSPARCGRILHLRWENRLDAHPRAS